MANPTGGFGLRATRNWQGSAGNFQLTHRALPYTLTNGIGFGDLVTWAATSPGFIDVATATSTMIVGVFYGCQYYNASLGVYNWYKNWSGTALATTSVPSTTEPGIDCFVIEDPRVVFTIRASSGVVTSSNIGDNAVILPATQTSAGISQSVLGSSSGGIATTTTFPLRIVGLSKQIGNDNTLANNLVEVVMNVNAISTLTGF